MKKILLVTNFLILGGIILLITLRESPQKKKLPPCSYQLDDFDFHHEERITSPNIILLGNSLIRHAQWDTLLHRKDFINRGISGDNLKCIFQRLKYLKGTSAKICFIEGGINDLPAQNIDTLFEVYKNIVAFWRSENVIPVINLVLYISPKAGDNHPYRKDYLAINTLIRDLNNKLRSYAIENDIEFIDLNKLLSDEQQLTLREEYTLDGIHITESAYKIWATEIDVILSKYKIISSSR